MEILSILLFFIYSMVILVTLVFISPILAAFVMIIVPMAIVYILPEESIGFFSIIQFSYEGIHIYNLHVLLLIWSAFIGIIAYAEVLTWYLLRETAISETIPAPAKGAQTQGNVPAPHTAAQGHPDSIFFKIKDFLQKLIKILKGEKIKTRP